MGQFLFLALFMMAILAGAFAYFVPAQKNINPMKFVMDTSGYNFVEQSNSKKIEQFNLTTNRGVVQIRRQMDSLALEQQKILDMIKDQQLVLKNTGKEASDIMLQASEKNGKDVLRLKALAAQMQDEQRLLVAHGQDLIVLNNQLAKNRQWIADQIDLSNMNNENSRHALQEHYNLLKDQSAKFFDKVAQNNQEVRDQTQKMKDRLRDLANNAAANSSMQEQDSRERMQQIMDKEHEDMAKLADNEERNRNLLKEAQENISTSKELADDSLQRTEDSIEQERQKAKDQQLLNQQRIADQMQRLKDQQNR